MILNLFKPLFFKAPRLLCEVSAVTNDLISSEFVGPVIQVSSAQHFRQAFANSTLEANVRNSVCFVKTAWLKVETRKYIVLCFFQLWTIITMYQLYIVCNNHHVNKDFCWSIWRLLLHSCSLVSQKEPAGVIPISASSLSCLCRGYSLITFANRLHPVDLQLFVRLFRKKKELGKVRSKFGNRICKHIGLCLIGL